MIMQKLLLFFLIIFFPLFASCEKQEHADDIRMSKEAEAVNNQFVSIAENGTVSEAFLFFTDPHLLGGENYFSQSTKNHLVNSFGTAKELYDAMPLDFCLCGGDWLNNGDTQEMAREKLLFADTQMKGMFSHYYKMMGNHDTNYQGIISTEDNGRGDLPREFIDKEYFSETGSAYYSFMGKQTKFYVLDSGLDWNTKMNDYRWEQIQWLAKELQQNWDEHIAVCIHMFYNDVPTITPMAQELVSLCSAFNSRTSYKLNDEDFVFAGKQGVIHFFLTGHCHIDFCEKINGLPVIGTVKFIKETNPFDVFILDYNAGYIDIIRVGFGENRRIKMNLN